MMMDDRALVRDSLRGDRKAFEALVGRYEKTVYQAAFRILNDPDDAADVTQTVFLNVFEHLDAYKPRYRFFSWIYRITVNTALNFQRQRKQGDDADGICSDARGPDENLVDMEQGEIVQGALMRIALEYRVVVVLNYFLDFSYAEIADVLDLPEKKVKSRLFTARRMLRDILVNEISA